MACKFDTDGVVIEFMVCTRIVFLWCMKALSVPEKKDRCENYELCNAAFAGACRLSKIKVKTALPCSRVGVYINAHSANR